MPTLQEMFGGTWSGSDALKLNIKEIQTNLEEGRPETPGVKGTGVYDHGEANIFGTGTKQAGDKQLSAEEKRELQEFLRKVTFRQLAEKSGYVREFLAKSGTTGISGAAYLIPDKTHQVLYDYAMPLDICDQISIAMLGPEAIPGASVKVDIMADGSIRAWDFSSGGSLPDEEVETAQATITPVSFGVSMKIGNDLVEDSQFELMELHIRKAGEAIGEEASNKALTILGTATDGDGTVNAAATGDANETRWEGATTTDIEDTIAAVLDDNHDPNTMAMTKNAMMHSVIRTAGSQYEESNPWIYDWLKGGWPTRMGPLSIVYSNCDYLSNKDTLPAAPFTDQKTIVFDKSKALVTGRKRWLRVERYSDPVRDLAGAVVSARQDSITVYDDSVYRLTET